MSLEKGIITATSADKASYEYKPRELNLNSSTIAKTFVSEDAFVSKDFKISDLVAQQAGITQLADDAQRDKINALVLEQLKDVQEKAYKEGYELGLVEGTEKAFQDSRGAD